MYSSRKNKQMYGDKSQKYYTLVEINKLLQKAMTLLHFTNVEQNNTDTEEFMFHDIIHSTLQSRKQ